ncbi:hypothetical protein HMPREF0004_4619 [Achromobacter piechaudii ATCC 43553]|uniref:Uncharacterized protein n=1 Tax=Achromobacter piechaudii ATCC 43553 TaxID=742159 RepID=D4XGM2_9BURK|nr:hypothetical protein HMPREF0004_4619 [Achromobacter piechaudii ATCC 43553]
MYAELVRLVLLPIGIGANLRSPILLPASLDAATFRPDSTRPLLRRGGRLLDRSRQRLGAR